MTVKIENILDLVDHCEFDHEFEIAPGTTPAQIRQMHANRHEWRDDWNHTHHKETVQYTTGCPECGDLLTVIGRAAGGNVVVCSAVCGFERLASDSDDELVQRIAERTM